LERKETQQLGETAVFRFQFQKDDLEREAREASQRFKAYLDRIGEGVK
jgi:hypothetical protein